MVEASIEKLERKMDSLQSQANFRKGWFMAIGAVMGTLGTWLLSHFFDGKP